MKTQEELKKLKEEVENINEKLHELTPEELEQVTGGLIPIPYVGAEGKWLKEKGGITDGEGTQTWFGIQNS